MSIFGSEVKCFYPEERNACDDDHRCTRDYCRGRTGCGHEQIPGCFEPKLTAVVKAFSIEEQLTLTLTEAKPDAVYDLTIAGVPHVPDRRLVVTTNSEGVASIMTIYRHHTDLPSTCGLAFPPVQITAVRRGTPVETARTTVAASRLRPC